MSTFTSLLKRNTELLPSRDSDDSTAMSGTMIDLLIALMVLVFVALLLVGGLYFMRRIRRARAIARQSLPTYNDVTQQTSNHRRLTITATPYGRGSSIYVYDEKSSMISNPASPPQSPVPEIRITFPDEQDEAGRRQSGRVVVVRLGETGGVGLEPLKEEEQLPAYQKDSGERFHSIDMERIGGLKEKDQYS